MPGRLLRPILLAVIFGAGSLLHLWLTFTDTSTEDEHVHIYAGTQLLERGRTSINLEHPPLAKVLAAMSLRLARPISPEPVELWTGERLGHAVARFVYLNRLTTQQMLVWSRLPFLLLTIALAVIVYFAALRFGLFAAVAAAALTMFSPLLLAVGHLAHTDLAVTLFVLAAWVCGMRVMESGRSGMAIAAGVLFGLAMLSKYSALVFFGVFVVAALIASRRRLPVLIMVVVAIAVLWVGMLASYRNANSEYVDHLARATGRTNPLLELPVVRALGIYLFGIQSFLVRGGLTVNYFAGDFSPNGWWFYFPVAFALKTPLGLLLLIVIAVAVRLRRFDRIDAALFAPVLVYFLVSLFSSYNIGIRHLLPIYPLLHLLVARSVELPKVRVVAGTLIAIATAEALLVFPHEVGYVNLLAGPRETATFILSDSNVDWGQDNGRLRELLRRRGWAQARVLLMGGALPEREVDLGVQRIDPRAPLQPGIYAVSRALFVELTEFATLPPGHPVRQRLIGQPRFGEPYGVFLLQMSKRGNPVAHIGNSIDVYQVP